MTVAQCQAGIDAVEFVRWQEFWKLEPFGDERRQLAGIALAVAESWLKKRGGGRWKVEDFLPAGTGERAEQTPEQIERTLMGFFGFPANGPSW